MTTDTDAATCPPVMTGMEASTLVAALDRSRAQFAWKCGGLDATALGRPHPPSTMTLGGLLKHMARVEDRVTADMLTGEPLQVPWDDLGFDADRDWEWHSAADDPPELLYNRWRCAVRRSRLVVAALLADAGLDQPAKFGTSATESPTLRQVLVELHDTYARHVGHADLLREAIDGLVGEDPPQH